MSFTRTIESRPYDVYYDPVYTTPSNYIQNDNRVISSVSNTNIVTGTGRFKYFRRPIMPRISAIPPQILLAPTSSENPLIPVEEEPEPATKHAEVQTVSFNIFISLFLCLLFLSLLFTYFSFLSLFFSLLLIV